MLDHSDPQALLSGGNGNCNSAGLLKAYSVTCFMVRFQTLSIFLVELVQNRELVTESCLKIP